MSDYIKLNTEPVSIEYTADDHEDFFWLQNMELSGDDEERDYVPAFWFNDKKYFLDDFLRTHNNPWIGGEFPEYIHGVEANEYYKPLYIEIIDGGDAVNIYKER